MALAKLIESLIDAVQTHRQPENDRLEEIRRLDAEIAAACWKQNLVIPSVTSKSFELWGQTHIPHVRGRKKISGQADLQVHHFEPTDNWLQAMRALALMDGNAKPITVSEIAREVGERVGKLTDGIITSFELPSPQDRVRRVNELTSEISHDIFPVITWIERNRPQSANLEKHRLFQMQDGAAKCAATNIPEYEGGEITPVKEGEKPSAGAMMTATFYVFCNMFGRALLGWADEIEHTSKHPQNADAKTNEHWSSPMSKREMARRITGRTNARARDVEPLLEKFGVKPVSDKKWIVRLDEMDANTRQKLESTD